MEEIEIFGWKGKDKIKFFKDNNGYNLIEHRKNKETNQINTQKHFISFENYNILINFINQLEPGIIYTSKYLARKLIQLYKWNQKENMSEEQFMNALWGGKYRAKYYFPYLYYPLKIAEAKGIIKYIGRGNIIKCVL